jgi:DNA-directed RNA polymerase specialized sigma24 family protein
VALNILNLAAEDDSDQIIALDDAFKRLEAENPEAAQLVRLRFYCGLSMADTAEAMQIPRRTLDRRWEYARAWLMRAMEESEEPSRRKEAAEDA